MKINEKDLELIVHNLIIGEDFNNDDLECNNTRESIINIVILLYQEMNTITNIEDLKELIDTLL